MLGVLGGMGPLASAAFVDTIYEINLRDPEQESPAVLLLSSPNIPDRTEALLAGREEDLASALENGLDRLRKAGATRSVICCVTLHSVLYRVRSSLRNRVISLLDLILLDERLLQERHLMLCTTGTRRLGVFEKHPGWERVSDRIVFPNDREQERVHNALYALKRGAPPAAIVGKLRPIIEAHELRGFVAGCTEMHLVSRHLRQQKSQDLSTVDPLLAVAQRLPELLSNTGE